MWIFALFPVLLMTTLETHKTANLLLHSDVRLRLYQSLVTPQQRRTTNLKRHVQVTAFSKENVRTIGPVRITARAINSS
jgi:phosphopantetheine adenylyltransferase